MPAATDEKEMTVTVSGVPETLVEEIDQIAQKEDRSRSAFIRRELERVVAERREKKPRKSA